MFMEKPCYKSVERAACVGCGIVGITVAIVNVPCPNVAFIAAWFYEKQLVLSKLVLCKWMYCKEDNCSMSTFKYRGKRLWVLIYHFIQF